MKISLGTTAHRCPDDVIGTSLFSSPGSVLRQALTPHGPGVLHSYILPTYPQRKRKFLPNRSNWRPGIQFPFGLNVHLQSNDCGQSNYCGIYRLGPQVPERRTQTMHRMGLFPQRQVKCRSCKEMSETAPPHKPIFLYCLFQNRPMINCSF